MISTSLFFILLKLTLYDWKSELVNYEKSSSFIKVIINVYDPSLQSVKFLTPNQKVNYSFIFY